MARGFSPRQNQALGVTVLEDFSASTVGSNPATFTITDSGAVAGSTVKASSDVTCPLTTSGKVVKFQVVGGNDAAGFGFPAMTSAAVAWDLSRAVSIDIYIYITGGPSGATGLGAPNYLANMNTIAAPSIQFSSDAGFTNASNCAINNSTPKNKNLIEGWNVFSMKLSEFTVLAGTTNWASIIRWRVRVQGNTSSTLPYQIYIGGLAINARQRPQVVFGFDNSLVSPWTQYQAWKAANPNSADVPLVYYHNQDAIDTDASHLTSADFAPIVAAGSEHSIHSGPPLGSVAYDDESQHDVIASISSMQAYLSAAGYTSGANHFAYPLGRFGRQPGSVDSKAQIYDWLRQCNIYTARTIQPNNSTTYTIAAAQCNRTLPVGGPTDPLMLYCYGIDSAQTRDNQYGGADPGAWASGTGYTVSNKRRPTAPNGFYYTVSSISGSGTSGGTEPSWPTVNGGTVIDNPGANQVVWTCTAPLYVQYLEYLIQQGGMMEFYTHWVTDSAQGLSRMGLTEFSTFLSLLDRYRRMGYIDIVTKSQWYNSLSSGTVTS